MCIGIEEMVALPIIHQFEITSLPFSPPHIALEVDGGVFHNLRTDRTTQTTQNVALN